jgi:hypothetical protein
MFSINTLARIAVAKPVFALAKYAPAGSVIIRKISHLNSDKKMFGFVKTRYFRALARACATAIA